MNLIGQIEAKTAKSVKNSSRRDFFLFGSGKIFVLDVFQQGNEKAQQFIRWPTSVMAQKYQSSDTKYSTAQKSPTAQKKSHGTNMRTPRHKYENTAAQKKPTAQVLEHHDTNMRPPLTKITDRQKETHCL